MPVIPRTPVWINNYTEIVLLILYDKQIYISTCAGVLYFIVLLTN